MKVFNGTHNSTSMMNVPKYQNFYWALYDNNIVTNFFMIIIIGALILISLHWLIESYGFNRINREKKCILMSLTIFIHIFCGV